MATVVPFTQFMRPNGRRVPVSIERPEEIAAEARRLIGLGYRFEIESLMTGHVSMEVVGPEDEDGDPVSLAVEVVPNGTEVPAAVDRLVLSASKAVS